MFSIGIEIDAHEAVTGGMGKRFKSHQANNNAATNAAIITPALNIAKTQTKKNPLSH